MKRIIALSIIFISLCNPSFSQSDDELLNLLGEDTIITENTFYSTRVINSHTVEMVPKGVLEFRISHRFGDLSNGAYDLFGLDAATMRMGFDYGITDKFTAGVGRSTIQKTYDGFVKYQFMQQQSGAKVVPISLAFVSGISTRTLDWSDTRYDSYYTNRLGFYQQLLIAKKFNDWTSIQLMPTMVHRNLVQTKEEKNDVYSIGAAVHQKILPSLVMNVEYFHNLPNQVADQYTNSLSLGLIFNTGWHSFSIHVSNSSAMYERGFITETTKQIDQGQLHFGFNITREFHLVENW